MGRSGWSGDLVATGWVPDVGDIIWVDLNPTVGQEQAGKRPALVLSPAAYNAKTSLLVACAMTSQVKGYPFEVGMPDGGVVLADQLKCLDWRMRNAQRKGKAPAEVLKQVRELLGKLLQITPYFFSVFKSAHDQKTKRLGGGGFRGHYFGVQAPSCGGCPRWCLPSRLCGGGEWSLEVGAAQVRLWDKGHVHQRHLFVLAQE